MKKSSRERGTLHREEVDSRAKPLKAGGGWGQDKKKSNKFQKEAEATLSL